jgi:tetratricopeptide (TPR) repeat protein
MRRNDAVAKIGSLFFVVALLLFCSNSPQSKVEQLPNLTKQQIPLQNNGAGQRAIDSVDLPNDENIQNVINAIKRTGLAKYLNVELIESLSVNINNNDGKIYILLLAIKESNGILLVCKYTEGKLTIIDENNAILDTIEIDLGNHSLLEDNNSTFYLLSEYGPNVRSGDMIYFTVNSNGVFVDSLIRYHKAVLFDDISGVDAYIRAASISQKDFGTLRLKDLKMDIWDNYKIEFKIQEQDKLPPFHEVFEKISEESKKDKYYLKRFAGSDKDIERYESYLKMYPLSDKNHTMYNDIGYYLEQAEAYKEAIYVLNAVLEKYPQRVVAYLNIADAYWGNNEKAKAKEMYAKYVDLMKAQKKDASKIPKRVYDRASIQP